MAGIFCTHPAQADPVLESVWDFGVPLDYPVDGLVLAPDGYLWGFANYGGGLHKGAIFKVKPDGSDWRTVLSLTNNGLTNKGSVPQSRMILGNDGYMYGTTSAGGGLNGGTIFRISIDGKLTTLAELIDAGHRTFQSPLAISPYMETWFRAMTETFMEQRCKAASTMTERYFE